jgi:hypothetical protein
MPPGLEAFLIAFAFVGVAIGTVVGAASAWRAWRPLPAFGVALLLSVAAAFVGDLAARFNFEAMLGAVLLAPLVAFLPASRNETPDA